MQPSVSPPPDEDVAAKEEIEIPTQAQNPAQASCAMFDFGSAFAIPFCSTRSESGATIATHLEPDSDQFNQSVMMDGPTARPLPVTPEKQQKPQEEEKPEPPPSDTFTAESSSTVVEPEQDQQKNKTAPNPVLREPADVPTVDSSAAKEAAWERFKTAGVSPRVRTAGVEDILQAPPPEEQMAWLRWKSVHLVEGEFGKWFFISLVILNGIMIGIQASQVTPILIEH